MSRTRSTTTGIMTTRGLSERDGLVRLQRGVTLYELLFVVALMGLLATVMMPSKGPSDGLRLDLAAVEVADALRFARSETLRSGQPHGVHFQEDKRRLSVFRMDTATSPAKLVYDIYHPVDRNLYARELTEKPFDFSGRMQVTATFQSACDNSEAIYFDANGTPWCLSPDDALLRKFGVALQIGSASRVVAMYGINGRVLIL